MTSPTQNPDAPLNPPPSSYKQAAVKMLNVERYWYRLPVQQRTKRQEQVSSTLPIISLDAPSRQDQIEYIEQVKNVPLKRGEVWCLLPLVWYDAFQKYQDQAPGPIDTTVLLDSNAPLIQDSILEFKEDPNDTFTSLSSAEWRTRLVTNVMEEGVLIPSIAFDCLDLLYGRQGPRLARRVRRELQPGQFFIDLFPPLLALEYEAKRYVVTGSRAATLRSLVDCALSSLNKVIQVKVTLDDRELALDDTLLRLGLDVAPMGQEAYTETLIMLEIEATLSKIKTSPYWHPLQGPDSDDGSSSNGSPIRRTAATAPKSSILSSDEDGMNLSPFFTSAAATAPTYVEDESPLEEWNTITTPIAVHPDGGLCGFQNLGNTCFMNSALQCLLHTPELIDYFMQGLHVRDLNRLNPLGMHGKVADAYAALVRQVWQQPQRFHSPRDFKYTIGRFAPQFIGYQQHDAQELLAFLLDGLHEDLNRIKQKPYVEYKDAEGRPDAVVADEMWQLHKQRNDSVIVDLFQGQFKSTLICPQCAHVSVTFDPFMYLSLPIPVNKERFITLLCFDWESFRFEKIQVSLAKTALVKDLIAVLPKQSAQWMICDVFASKIHQVFDSYERVARWQPQDNIICYPVQVAEKNSFTTSSTSGFNVYGPSGGYQSYTSNSIASNEFNLKIYFAQHENLIDLMRDPYKSRPHYFGFPLVLSVTQVPTYRQLLEFICSKLNLTLETISNRFGLFITDQQGVLRNPMDVMNLSLRYTSSPDEPLQLSSNQRYLTFVLQSDLVKELETCPIFDVIDKVPVTASSSTLNDSGLPRLQDCLNLFTQKEQLSANDPWYCPKCRLHQQATKQMEIWRLPRILVIHLKRFQFTRSWRDKIDATVQFPVEGLIMQSTVERDGLVYDLFAVSHHFGGLGGGHYTAYAKQHLNGKWYDFDDTSVSPLSRGEDAVKSSAYVLFYRRRNS